MRTFWIIGLLAFALAGCASEPAAPPPAPPPPAEAAPPPPPVADSCGLKEARKYVGRNRSEIPVPVNPALQRVACTTCPVTLDFNPNRLNFFFDAQTGIVKEVKCG
jgi:hypothetical protein